MRSDAPLKTTIDDAVKAGGKRFAPPTTVGFYVPAMICDPEGNQIGLIEAFGD